jgi:hypothetical protein
VPSTNAPSPTIKPWELLSLKIGGSFSPFQLETPSLVTNGHQELALHKLFSVSFAPKDPHSNQTDLPDPTLFSLLYTRHPSLRLSTVQSLLILGPES